MILLTGASGFVGGSVAAALRAEGHPVRCLVRHPAKADSLEKLGCELVAGDMADAESLRRAVAGCEAVVHLVAIIAGRPSDFERVMAQGTRDLVAAAAAMDVRRFVLTSALGTGAHCAAEIPYYRAKQAMEEAVRESGLPYVVLRPSFVFGKDGGALPQFLRIVRMTPIVPVMGPGTQRIQPIWIEDVAASFVRSLDLPAGSTFDLGGPDVVTWNELWQRLARALGKRRLLVHVPFGLARPPAALLELLPSPPLTRDQLAMLALGDNVCDPHPAAEAFGLHLMPLEQQLERAVRA